MTHDTDALVGELRDRAQVAAVCRACKPEELTEWQAADAIARLTKERDEARDAFDLQIQGRHDDHIKLTARAEIAEDALSAARAELEKKEGWVRVPIEVENACLNWLANRIQGNSHGEDVELGRLMRGLQTYIQAVADGTNK